MVREKSGTFIGRGSLQFKMFLNVLNCRDHHSVIFHIQAYFTPLLNLN